MEFLDINGLEKLVELIQANFAAKSHNHSGTYVESLGTSGNYVTWKKGSTTNNLTVPYATRAGSASSVTNLSNSLTVKTYLNTSIEQATSTTTFNGSSAKTIELPDRIHNHSTGEVRGSSTDAGKVVYVSGSNPYNLMTSSITSTELGYLDGVTSNIQTQLNKKVTNGFTTNRAICSSSTGTLTVSSSCTKEDLDALGNLTASKIVTTNSSGRVNGTSIGTGLVSNSSGLSLDIGNSGSYWDKAAYINNTGVMEIGKYIDFHCSNSDTNDYNVRFTVNSNATTSTKVIYELPSATSGEHTLAALGIAQTWSAYQTFSAGAGESSDIRFKEDIKKVDNILDDINKIDVIEYTWNHPNEEGTNHTFGVSADQVEGIGGICTLMVHEADDEYKTKSVQYDRFGVLAIKGLQEVNEKLEKKCAKLENALKLIGDKLGLNIEELLKEEY